MLLDEVLRVLISLSKTGQCFSATPDEALLAAARDAGLDLPQRCRSGNCGACRARLLHGDVHYPNGKPLGLSDTEAAEGFILLCQARARTDLILDEAVSRNADDCVVKRLPCRVARSERWAHDVLGVFLRLPPAEDFRFAAGQYIDVLLSAGRRRSFSVASPPHDSRLLELHVRRVPGGEFTDPLFAGDPAHALLTIEGPLGRFVYRPGTAPMLLIGGGTGLAPLKSIVRHVLDNSLPRTLSLYWGVRSAHDLYAHAQLVEMARRCVNFRYVAVLSEPDLTWSGRRGLVHTAVLDDRALFDPQGGLGAHDVYASGPPAMIDAVRSSLARLGVDETRLSADSFDYSPDSLERHRSMAAKRS